MKRNEIIEVILELVALLLFVIVLVYLSSDTGNSIWYGVLV